MKNEVMEQKVLSCIAHIQSLLDEIDNPSDIDKTVIRLLLATVNMACISNSDGLGLLELAKLQFIKEMK